MVSSSVLHAQKLSDYTWKQRIIILSDTDTDFKNAKAALTKISTYTQELNERDIILFLHRNGQLYDTDLKITGMATISSIPNDYTGYVLLGKDGGIKSKKSYPINPEELFTLIDGMPMRRAELKANN